MTKVSIAIDAYPAANSKARPLSRWWAERRQDINSALVVIKKYLQLAKTGIVFGNLVSVAGGFFLASKGHIDFTLFLATIVGVSLVVASGCVFNNYIDRDIDMKMRRTQNRVLVLGLVSPIAALIYATVLGVVGASLLYYAANILSAILAVIGFIIYVGVYSLYMKRHSVFGTLVGSLSGAMPPVIGYCAVSNHFDMAAWLLLFIFSIWQMPHSYAIAIVYFDDYAAAGIPVLPVARGIPIAKTQIMLYILAFIAAALLLTMVGYVGYTYLAVTALIGLSWLYAGWSGYRSADNRLWARKMFIFSIVSIMALSFMMSVDFNR